MKHYIYTLSHPVTLEVRYIGVTTNLKTRLNRHCHITDNTHKECWVKSLKTQNLKPLIEEIDSFDNKEEAYAMEIYWISQFKAWGFDLCNLSEGGMGGNFTMKEETKIKISQVLRDKYKNTPHPNKGKPLSEEHKNALKKAKKISKYKSKGAPKGTISPRRRAVLVYKEGIFIEEVESIQKTCEKYNFPNANAHSVLIRKNKSIAGYVLSFKGMDYTEIDKAKLKYELKKDTKLVDKYTTLKELCLKNSFNYDSVINAHSKGITYKGYTISRIP